MYRLTRKITTILIVFIFTIECTGLGHLFSAVYAQDGLRPMATGEEKGDSLSSAAQIKKELDTQADSNSLFRSNPSLFKLLIEPPELANIEMVAALATQSDKYLPQRSLKLLYPASGWDIGAIFVALELIEKAKIENAELFFVDLLAPDAITIDEIEKIRPYVEELGIGKKDDLLYVSFRYKNKPVKITRYTGVDEEVLEELPRDLNLLYYHSHGLGGFPPFVFPPIWEKFIQHCQGPVVIFSHKYPHPLIEIISDWWYFTELQFSRWQTVIPAYAGGAVFALEKPIDVELIRKAWGDFSQLSPNHYRINMAAPTENMDRLAVSKGLSRLRGPISGLSNTMMGKLIGAFKQQTIPFEEAKSLAEEVYSGKNFNKVRQVAPGLCQDVILHCQAAGLKAFGLDLDKPHPERIRQVKDRLEDESLNNSERIFLIEILWLAGKEVRPGLVLDLYEKIVSDKKLDKELRMFDIAILRSNGFFDATPILKELVKRMEYADNLDKMGLYLILYQLFEPRNKKRVPDEQLAEQKILRDKLFKILIEKFYKVAKRSSGISETDYGLCVEMADLLIRLDLDRTLNYVKSPGSKPELTRNIEPELVDKILFPIMHAVASLLQLRIELSAKQNQLIDDILAKYQWPKRIRRRGLIKHCSYKGNIELCAYLSYIFADDPEAKKVIDAIFVNPRHLYLPTYARFWAYLDRALPTQRGQTISQPKTVVWITKELNLRPGARVLVAGTGSGWNTGVISKMVGKKGQVYSIEIDERLAKTGESNLKRLGISNVTVYKGDIGLEPPEEVREAPFDGILITAGVPRNDEKLKILFEETLKPLLKEGGRIVFPLAEEGSTECCLVVAKKEKGVLFYEQLTDISFGFVPLRGKSGHTLSMDSKEISMGRAETLGKEKKIQLSIQGSA